jgi:hypothetical protein
VAVSSESPPRVEVKLETIPRKTIMTNPSGGDIYRLGGMEKLGTAPFGIIVSAECVFEIRKEGYEPCVIGLGPSSPDRVSVPLSPLPRSQPDAAAVRQLDNPLIDAF